MGEDAPGAPVLLIPGSAWSFAPPSADPGPLSSICMPDFPIPAPTSNMFDSETELRVEYVPWILQQADYYKYKGEMIRWINHRLSTNSTNATSDGTIGVIMSLLMWEVCATEYFAFQISLLALSNIVKMERHWSSKDLAANKRLMNDTSVCHLITVPLS
jgi:hypothetical protein